jgi:hypothetical protein
MIYVMSDLHGEFAAYLAMMIKIGFSERDTVYILGAERPLILRREKYLQKRRIRPENGT